MSIACEDLADPALNALLIADLCSTDFHDGRPNLHPFFPTPRQRPYSSLFEDSG